MCERHSVVFWHRHWSCEGQGRWGQLTYASSKTSIISPGEIFKLLLSSYFEIYNALLMTVEHYSFVILKPFLLIVYPSFTLLWWFLSIAKGTESDQGGPCVPGRNCLDCPEVGGAMHHSLAGILACIQGGRRVGSSLHTSLCFLVVAGLWPGASHTCWLDFPTMMGCTQEQWAKISPFFPSFFCQSI